MTALQKCSKCIYVTLAPAARSLVVVRGCHSLAPVRWRVLRKAELYIRFFPLPSSLRGESLQLHSTFLRFVLHGKKAALELHSFARETGGPRAHRLFPPPHAVIFAAAQDDRTGRCQHGDYCAPRRGASGGIFCERSGLHLAGQLPAVDNCRSSSVGYRRQDELT